MKIQTLTSILIALLLNLSGCGLDAQEDAYQSRLTNLNELSTKLDSNKQKDIQAQILAFKNKYAALPKEQQLRSDALGTLNQDMNTLIKNLETDIDKIPALDPERLKLLVGYWQGNGMTLNISADGSVSYKYLQGGTSKSIEGGRVIATTPSSFTVQVLLIDSTFAVNRWAFKDGEKTKMVVDDIELTKKQ